MEREDRFLNDLALKLHNMGLGSVAIFFLEEMKPLHNVFFNLGIFSKPFAEILFPPELYTMLLNVLNDRDKIEYLLKRLEELEDATLDSDKSG